MTKAAWSRWLCAWSHWGDAELTAWTWQVWVCETRHDGNVWPTLQRWLFRWNGQTTFTARATSTVGWRWYSTAASHRDAGDSRSYSSRTSRFHALPSTIRAADTTSSVSSSAPLITACFCAWCNGWVSGLMSRRVKAKLYYAILVADRSETGRRPASSWNLAYHLAR